MERLTPGLAFTARELHESGIWTGRISELLDLEERDVRSAIDERDLEPLPSPAAMSPPSPEPVAEMSPEPVAELLKAPSVWPPLAGSDAEWSTRLVMVRGVERREIRARPVLLWGKRVEINEGGEVWCPSCLQFRTTAQLGHPWNSCPVGLPRRDLVLEVEDAPVGDGPRYRPVSGRREIDFLREPL